MSTRVTAQLSSGHLWKLGNYTLKLSLAVGLMLILWIAWSAPDIASFLPIVFVALPIVWFLFQRPLLNLFVVLAGFILIAGYEEGFQVTEILYGLYFLGFLGHWFFKRLLLYQEPVFTKPEERVLILFLILVSLSFPLTVLFGGSMKEFMSEWLSLSLLAFYFPIKEAIERHEKGLYVILGVVAWVGMFVLIRNVLKFQDIVSGAEYGWQIARGRAVTNESLLLVPAIFSLAGVIFQTKWLPRLTLAALFLLFLAGVILTQSRGYWMAFLAGAIIMILLTPRRQKLTLLGMGAVTIVGVVGVGLIFFGDTVLLLVYGVAERFLSIMTATTQDISLVNRFKETSAVWESVRLNPILGYGMGVSYRVQDIILDITVVKAFVHNGYIALWYKFGIWGLGLMLFFLGSVVRNAVLAFRTEQETIVIRVACLAAAASFCALFLSAITSNPFYINDTMFIYAVLAGISGGCWSLVQSREATSIA